MTMNANRKPKGSANPNKLLNRTRGHTDIVVAKKGEGTDSLNADRIVAEKDAPSIDKDRILHSGDRVKKMPRKDDRE